MTSLPGQPRGGDSPWGPHWWPISLLTHRAPALHWGPRHAGEGFVALRMPRGTWVSLDARVPITVPRTRDQVRLPRPAQSGSSHTGPKCWSQTGALSSPDKCLCQKASGLSHSSRPTLPVLQAKQIQRFSNILCPCFCQIFLHLRVYKHSQIRLDIAV